MTKLLKYLFPFVAVFALLSCADTSVSAEDGILASEIVSFEESASELSFTETQSEICLPRQASVSNTQRVQNSARRSSGVYKNNNEFTKSGKVVNPSLRYSVQKESVIAHSSLVVPANRLIFLGILII